MMVMLLKSWAWPCLKCSQELVRYGRYGMFIGFIDYPNCFHLESLDQEAKLVPLTYPAPIVTRASWWREKTVLVKPSMLVITSLSAVLR